MTHTFSREYLSFVEFNSRTISRPRSVSKSVAVIRFVFFVELFNVFMKCSSFAPLCSSKNLSISLVPRSIMSDGGYKMVSASRTISTKLSHVVSWMGSLFNWVLPVMFKTRKLGMKPIWSIRFNLLYDTSSNSKLVNLFMASGKMSITLCDRNSSWKIQKKRLLLVLMNISVLKGLQCVNCRRLRL